MVIENECYSDSITRPYTSKIESEGKMSTEQEGDRPDYWQAQELELEEQWEELTRKDKTL